MVSNAAGVSVLKLSKVSCSEGPFESRTGTAQTAMSFAKAAAFVYENKMTFLSPKALALHRELIEGIEQQGVPGVIVETGVAAGGSALVFTSIKRKERCIHLYDTFEGMPAPSEKDGADVHERYAVIQSGEAGDDYYGYNEHLLSWVKGKFQEAGYPPETNGVDFHQGLFEDEFNPNFEIAYAQLDGDWYESTYVVLDRATPKMALNGIIVLDDTKAYSGAADAVDDFFGVNATGVPDGESMNVSKYGKKFQINQQVKMYIKRLT